jgi:two-component system, chemotaxis family, chemotaxis protein CheY
LRILVLDDHKAFREQVVEILMRNGHEALGVEKAVDAIPLAESGAYDFVLVDFNMPEHDGIWFMQNVKRPRHTKALLVTAHVNNQIISRMIRSGASGYIIKPFDEDDLIRHLTFHTQGASRHHADTTNRWSQPHAEAQDQ